MRIVPFFIFFIFGCQVSELERSGKSRQGLPDAESWNATITLTNKGAKRAVIRAGHLEKYNERQYILLNEEVDADFFNEKIVVDNSDYYFSNVIARASKTMFNCRNEKINFKGRLYVKEKNTFNVR